MSNPVRKFNTYRDFDDEEENYPVRRANVPGAPPMNMPGYRPPAPRLLGEGEMVTRPMNVPQPLPGVRRNPNIPPQGTQRMPVARPAMPQSQGFNTQRRPQQQSRFSFLNGLSIARGSSAKLGIMVVGVVVAAALIFLAVSAIVNWWNVWQDDMTYGRPRTMQLDAWVGHNEQGGQPTHFIAQNINGEVNIYEIPGGDTSKMTVIKGPRLLQKNAELIPIKIRLEDVNADGHVDLVATVDGRPMAWVNEGGKFRSSTPEEMGKFKFSGGN